jgi:exodeoxyribonuclease V alpha subunit
LPADIVVVDEASMVDLAIMRQLVDALRPEAVLLLVGDPDQLYSVEAGSVLGDIVAGCPDNALPRELADRLAAVSDVVRAAPTSTALLAGQVLTLRHAWRAGGGLQRALDALRRGEVAAFEATLATEDETRMQWCEVAEPSALDRWVRAWRRRHAAVFDALLAAPANPAAALRALHTVQILCALRSGSFGAAGVNRVLTTILAEYGSFSPDEPWHPGRAVIVTRNDYARGLYNGDMGIALSGASGLRVWFDDAEAKLRDFSPAALPAHETAFAITIHRSQGSEYDHVAVVLPPNAEHPLLSRELLYTAVSRARHRVEIWGTRAALHAAVARRVQRHGGLRERLR